MKKKLLSMLLVLVMLLGMLPMGTLAAESYTFATGLSAGTGQVANVTEITLTDAVVRKVTVTPKVSGSLYTHTIDLVLSSCGETLGLSAVVEHTQKIAILNAGVNAESADLKKLGQGKKLTYTTTVPLEWTDNKATFTLSTRYGAQVKTQNSVYTVNLTLLDESYVNQAPTPTAAAASEKILVGETYTLNLAELFEDPDNNDSDLTYTVSIDGGEAQTAAASFSYTAEEIGTTEFVVTATDPEGASGTHTLTLEIAKNTPPAVAEGAISSANGVHGIPVAIDPSALFTDVDEDAMTYTVRENGGDAKTAAKEYTYTPASVGDHTLTFQATDARGGVSAAHTITLTAAENPAPVLTDAATAAAEGTIPFTYTLDLGTVFSDNTGDVLSYTVKIGEADPVAADTNYSYAPQTAGEHTLAFYATDRAGNVSPAYTVTITAAENPAPTLKGEATDTVSGIIPFSYTVDLGSIFADTDGDVLSYTVTIGDADPIAATANYSYSPETAGTYVLVFQATDTFGGTSPTYTVIVTANNNPAPTLAEGIGAASTGKAQQNFQWSCDISRFFADNEGDTLTYTVKIGEEDLVSADANFSHTFDTAGEKTLVFYATDSEGGVSPTHTVTLTVKESFDEIINTSCVASIRGDTWLSKITVTGPQIEGYAWNVEAGHVESIEHILYVRLDEATEDNAQIKLNYTAAADTYAGAVKGATSVTLIDGEGSVTVTTTKWPMDTEVLRTYKIYFTNEANIAPSVAENAIEEVAVNTGETFSLNLAEIFSDANGDSMTYTAQVNSEEASAVDADFSLVIGSSGTHTFVFTAADQWGATASHTVTVTAAMSEDTNAQTVLVPEGITPVFSITAGYDNNGMDIPGEALTAAAGAAQNGLVPYTVTVPEGIETVSVRAEGWGGVAFAVPEDGSDVTLRKTTVSAKDLAGNAVNSTVTVNYGEHTAKAGEDGSYLLVTGLEYTCTAIPADTAQFLTGTTAITVEPGSTDAELAVALPFNSPKTIIAPTGATVKLYDYNKYYDFTDLPLRAAVDNEDGTSTYYFTTGAADLSYRVSMDGKITKAGYWPGSQYNSVTVTYSNLDAEPNTRPDYDSSTNQGALADDSVMLNVNAQNFLSMSVGGTKTLKGYRAWEIIKNDSTNEIITPDFHFEILSSSDDGVVTLSDKASRSNGDGDWKTITAVKNGTAFVEVRYDAIGVNGGSYPGVYGATDPNRTGLVVIQVGGSTAKVNFGIDCFASYGSNTYSASNAKAWDAEFDTLYFTGDSGRLNLSPTADGDITEVAVSNNKGASWTTLTATEGVYTATIVPGNNIIRITASTGTAYQVVRGDKVTYKLTEIKDASDGDGIIEAGERIRVTINGLHLPIPKMAGNYNPGYSANLEGDSKHYVKYTFNGTQVQGTGVQYTLVTKGNYVDVTIPTDTEESAFTLRDGYIGLGVIGLSGFIGNGDSHRNIPDAGCTTRGSATAFHTRSMLPEITITLGSAAADNTPPRVRSDAPETASLELSENTYTYFVNLGAKVFTDDDSSDKLTYTVSVNGGEKTDVLNGQYLLERPEVGSYTLLFTATDGKASAEHTIELTVTEAKTSDPELGDGEDKEDEHVVYVSFVDFATRVAGESNVEYPNQLGTIVPRTAVPYTPGDTIADVTIRLLNSKGMTYQHNGTTKEGFYLSKIGNFSAGGIPVDEFGEFDAGNGSGWMITQNGVFIGQGASEFVVTDGDVIEWQYTCQLGKDIGDPYWDNEDDKDKDADKTDVEADVQVSVSGNTATVDKVVLPEADGSTSSEAGNIVLDFSEVESSQPITTVAIPNDIVKQIANASGEAQKLEIVLSGGAAIELDAAALSEKASKSGGSDVKVSIENTASSLVGAQKEAVGSRPAYDIKITSGGKNISDMGKPITVYVPYTLKTGEKARGLVVFYVDDNGSKERCVTSYDAANKRVKWNTDHLSVYMIDYDEKLASNPFDDVADSAYYYDAVLWAYDSGITSGTSDTTFSPDASCTRAQMVTFLWRAAGKPAAKTKTHSFTDVDESAYYYEALLWAVENGITSGTSATTFSPDAACTRGQMAAFLYRSAKNPAVSGTHAFNDVASDAYYNKAVVWAAAEGITSGTSATTFSPDAACTRGQMAAFLYRYLAK